MRRVLGVLGVAVLTIGILAVYAYQMGRSHPDFADDPAAVRAGPGGGLKVVLGACGLRVTAVDVTRSVLRPDGLQGDDQLIARLIPSDPTARDFQLTPGMRSDDQPIPLPTLSPTRPGELYAVLVHFVPDSAPSEAKFRTPLLARFTVPPDSGQVDKFKRMQSVRCSTAG